MLASLVFLCDCQPVIVLSLHHAPLPSREVK